LINEIADKENKTDREQVNKHNNTCPNCDNSNEKSIVDKISRVMGKGTMSGSMSGSIFGSSGYVSGRSETDTHAINNCNECGHQWKKRKSYLSFDRELLARKLASLLLNYWNEEDKTKELNTQQKLNIEQVNNLYAETYPILAEYCGYSLFEYVKKKIENLEYLRKHNKSIHGE
jgi:hypothetical protein